MSNLVLALGYLVLNCGLSKNIALKVRRGLLAARGRLSHRWLKSDLKYRLHR